MLTDSHFYKSQVNTIEGYFQTPRKEQNFGNVHPITGYCLIGLALKNSKGRVTEYLHRAIWKAHHKKEIPPGMQICHTNHKKEDCRISNLTLGTPSQNTLDSVPNRKGERKRTSYRNKCTVQSPNGEFFTFPSIAACCRELNLSQSTVGKALRGVPYVTHSYTRDTHERYKIIRKT